MGSNPTYWGQKGSQTLVLSSLLSSDGSSYRMDLTGFDLASGTKVIIWTKSPIDNNEWWTLTWVQNSSDNKKGFFLMISCTSGSVVTYNGSGDTAYVTCTDYNASSISNSQLWAVSQDSSGNLQFESAVDSNQVLDVRQAQTANGTNVIAFPRKTTNIKNQWWSQKQVTVS